MALQVLNRAQGFSPGSDLWIIPGHATSDLLKKINWYTNFQLSRAEKHQPHELPEQLKNIINENHLPNFHSEVSSPAAVLIPAERAFPAQKIIEISLKNINNEGLRVWFREVEQTWRRLNSPSLRIFLPPNFEVSKLNEYWPDKSKIDDILFVPT